jgi:hypothetical protein
MDLQTAQVQSMVYLHVLSLMSTSLPVAGGSTHLRLLIVSDVFTKHMYIFDTTKSQANVINISFASISTEAVLHMQCKHGITAAVTVSRSCTLITR